MPFINSVFLSATLSDLVKERKAALYVFNSTGILPFSMEAFPADYREKEDFIKKLIFEADYFALIIGGKYGEYLYPREKLSFTEWEYDTAVSYNKKILAFVPRNLDLIPANKTDNDKDKYLRLKKFINKVNKNRITKQYEYNNIPALKEVMFKSFSVFGYTDKSPSDYCGVWISTINEVSDGDDFFPPKSDEWVFYGREQHIYGTIRRLIPDDDCRIWSFVGMEFNGQLYLAFTENNKAKKSAGIVMLEKEHRVDEQMSGFYYGFSKMDSNNKPIPIPIILRKKTT